MQVNSLQRPKGTDIETVVILAVCCAVLSVTTAVGTLVLPLLVWKLFSQELRIRRCEELVDDVKKLDEVVDRIATMMGTKP